MCEILKRNCSAYFRMIAAKATFKKTGRQKDNNTITQLIQIIGCATWASRYWLRKGCREDEACQVVRPDVLGHASIRNASGYGLSFDPVGTGRDSGGSGSGTLRSWRTR